MNSDRLDVIAVGAHPDDVEIACGGTIAKLVQQGYRVGIIDLTDGEPTPGSPNPAFRLQEARKAGEVLGIHERVLLNLPNRKLFDTFENRVLLAREFRRWRPQVVMGFGAKTPMASPDHYQASLLTDAAIFYSRLTKWDDYFGGYTPHAIDRYLYFRLAVEPDLMHTESYHLTVDISQTLERKLRAIQCYESQFASKPFIIERVKASAVVCGSLAGVSAGEVFVAPRPYAINDLMSVLF